MRHVASYVQHMHPESTQSGDGKAIMHQPVGHASDPMKGAELFSVVNGKAGTNMTVASPTKLGYLGPDVMAFTI